MFRGIYGEKQVHKSDLDKVISRASEMGVEKLMITGTCLSDIKEAAILCGQETVKNSLYFTCGVHPTRCGVNLLWKKLLNNL